MAQVKVYGLAEQLRPARQQISDAIHDVLMKTLGLPPDKRFQRFFPLAADDFIFPADRSPRYLIVEISMFEGRTQATRKALITRLIEQLSQQCAIPVNDIEITIFETPRASWGIRGKLGDELVLSYRINV